MTPMRRHGAEVLAAGLFLMVLLGSSGALYKVRVGPESVPELCAVADDCNPMPIAHGLPAYRSSVGPVAFSGLVLLVVIASAPVSAGRRRRYVWVLMFGTGLAMLVATSLGTESTAIALRHGLQVRVLDQEIGPWQHRLAAATLVAIGGIGMVVGRHPSGRVVRRADTERR